MTWETMVGGAAKVLVSAVLNRFAKAPDIWLSYGRSGDHDLVRMHYQRQDGPRPAHPWVIIEARCLWPFRAPLYASDEEAMARGPAPSHHVGLHVKPDSGIFFIPLRDGQEFPASVYMLLKVERAVPGERRWVVARALRPSKFDLRAKGSCA